jgi:hypothetical protein
LLKNRMKTQQVLDKQPPLQLGRENVNLTSPHLEHLYKVRSNSTSSLNRLEQNTGHNLMRWIKCVGLIRIKLILYQKLDGRVSDTDAFQRELRSSPEFARYHTTAQL